MIMKKDLFIIKPKFKYRLSASIEIYAIKFLHHLLRIDFVSYRNLDAFDYRLNIKEDTFIRPTGTNTMLRMVKASRIPIAPRRHYFFNRGSEKRFSLFFSMPPEGTTSIDVIERERGGNACCNFYGVALTEATARSLVTEGNTLHLN